jgi:hypothetical protein
MKFSLVDDVRHILSIQTSDYPTQAGELISPFLDDMKGLYALARKQGVDITPMENPFDALQIVLIGAVFMDGDIDGPELETYNAVCAACNYEGVTRDVLVKVMSNLAREDELKTLRYCLAFVATVRVAEKDKTPYHNFLLGLWCLLLANEGLTESEYQYMVALYDEKEDDLPKDFEACKAALAN